MCEGSFAVRCPRCQVQATVYNAPLGMVIRNPSGGLKDAIYDPCKACHGTGYVPGVVLDAIQHFASRAKDPKAYYQEITNKLVWSYDHFSFMAGSMYVGVETDGYLHT